MVKINPNKLVSNVRSQKYWLVQTRFAHLQAPFKTSLGCRLLAVLEIGPEKFQTFPQGMSEDLGLLRVAAEKRGQGSSIKMLNHDG